MLEDTAAKSSGLRAGRSPDELLRPLLTWRLAAALLAIPLLLILLLVVYGERPLGALPPYPAVLLAFIVIVVLPGLCLQQALLRGHGPLVRVAVAPALGLSLTVVPGLIALERHLSLEDFSSMHAVVVAVACGLSIIFWRAGDANSPYKDAGGAGESRGGTWLLLTLVAVVLAGVMTIPFWASDELSSDYDDWTYMAYVSEYLVADEMNAREPFLGTDGGVNPRMRSNVWVVLQAMISDVTEVPPDEVLLEYLRPMLIVFVALATYALTQAMFHRRDIALVAVAFMFGYAFLDMSAHEGFGRNLFMRISEDKMVGGFILFPLALVFLLRFFSERSLGAYVGFSLIVMAISVVHPVPLAFLATAALSLGALRALTSRSPAEARSAALLLLPVGLASIWPFVQRQLLIDAAPDLFSTTGGNVTFRDEFHFVELGGGLLIGNFHMIMHPMMLSAIMVAPLVWWLARRDIGNQLVLALTGGALALFFFPPFATPLAEIMSPQTLWKVPWMIPTAPVFAYVTFAGVERLQTLRPLRWLRRGGLAARLAAAGAPVAVLIVTLAAVLVVHEQYARADGGAFYDWTSDDALLPGSELSIFRGGVDRAFSENWRVPDEERPLFDYMGRALLSDSVILADPTWINHMLPGLYANFYPLDFGGTAGAGERREISSRFADANLTVEELAAAVAEFRVDYIIVREVHAANDIVRELPDVFFLEEISPYQIYLVRR